MNTTLYTPERETYLCKEDDGLIMKVEKIMVKANEEEASLAYICYHDDGFREVVEDDCIVVTFFMDSQSGSISENSIKCLMSIYPDCKENAEAFVDLAEQLSEDWGITTVTQNDGTPMPLDEVKTYLSDLSHYDKE